MNPPAAILARARAWLARDAVLAAALTAAGLLEVLADPVAGASVTVSAVAVACTTVPLAWRRTAPLVPPAAIAVTLVAQAALDGFLVGHVATTLVALAIALYSAGRHVETAVGLGGAALCGVAAAGTRIAVDPAVHSVGQAVLTLVAVAMPLLIGRWVRGQALLQRRFAQRAERLERDRERDARDAAEEERMRIAADLQAAIAGRLQHIVRAADALPSRLRTGDHVAARAVLADVATTARDALGDVRRVLGILRREDQPAPLTPPGPEPVAPGATEPPVAAEPRATAARPGPRRREPALVGARGVNRLLVGVLFCAGVLDVAPDVPAADRVAAVVIAALIAAPLLWRRRLPLLAGGGVLGGVVLQSAVLDLAAFPVSDIAAVVCATYAIGAYTGRRTAIAGLLLAVTGAAAHAEIFYPGGVGAAVLGGVAAPWTVGRVIRGHRELTAQGREEALRAERARAREARAAVVAERMRVARELHDAVAHNISVIAIQAGGADGIVERDPERTIEIAALVGAVAREALSELGRLVGSPDGAAPADGAAPSLADVGALAARARDAGQPVELRVEGRPAALPAGVDLAAYRIVQEALTNASKHAAGARAQVLVRYEPHAVEVEVADDGRGGRRSPARRSGTGHGLIGIRERVALYGGTLDAGRRPSGGFRVHARLPIGGA